MKKIFFLLIMCFVSTIAFTQDAQEEIGGVSVDQQFEGFNLVGYSDDGEKSWDINGDTADVNGTEVDITNVDANAYGEETLNLKARKGLVDRETGAIQLTEDVVITSEDGATMKTDSLDWNREKDTVSTDDIVTLEDEVMKIKGEGMEAHPNMKSAKLNENVEAEIQAETPTSDGIKERNKISIKCDGPMEVNQLEHTAIFTDNVVATEETTGRVLKADYMEVYFDQDTRKIKKLICQGNVSVKQGDNTSYADKLEYNVDTQRLVLSGSPRLIFSTDDDTMDFEF